MPTDEVSHYLAPSQDSVEIRFPGHATSQVCPRSFTPLNSQIELAITKRYWREVRKRTVHFSKERGRNQFASLTDLDVMKQVTPFNREYYTHGCCA
jgi:hypothetical protein